MNNKVNYTLVGLLVIFGFALILSFSYWLLKPSADDEIAKYLIYFDESVLGLNLDAPVKYRGISVGKVSRLRINPKNSEQVEALITILKSTPIKSSTVAKLTSQGITGLSYINLNLGDNGAPALKAGKDEEYPVINSEASFLERFGQSFDVVSDKVSNTLSRTQSLLSDENQKQIALILSKTAILMDKMQRVLDEETIVNIQKSAKNLESSSAKLDKMMPNVDFFVGSSIRWEEGILKKFDSIMSSFLGMRSSADEVKRAIADGEFNLKEITGDMSPFINSTLLEMQQLMIKFEELLNQHDRSPSDLLFKQEQIKKGPGEQ